MAATESGELEKYRKYIQRRRVAPPVKDSMAEEPENNDEAGSTQSEQEVKSASEVPWWEKEAYTLLDKGDSRELEYKKPDYSFKTNSASSSALPVPRGRDFTLYKKLYSPRRSTTYTSAYRSYSSNQVQIEDNRASLMAIKVIKQALACFAILGIIVLLQSRPDMMGVLATIKKHVVETHIDPQSLFEGVKSVFNQFTRTLGGSP